MNPIVLADVVGIIGVGLVLLAYFLLQIERLTSMSLSYSMLNFIGACLIMYSLLFNWNTPSVIIEATWILISFYGIVKFVKKSLN